MRRPYLAALGSALAVLTFAHAAHGAGDGAFARSSSRSRSAPIVPTGGLAGSKCDGLPLTQSIDSESILPLHTPVCANRAFTFSEFNAIARSFDVPLSGWTITCVDFGVQMNQGAAWPVHVNLYVGDIEGPFAALVPVASAIPVIVPEGAALEHFTASFEKPVDVPGGSQLVIELAVPSRDPADGGDGGLLILGSNAGGETAPSYVRAPDCGADDFVTFASIGYPDVDALMTGGYITLPDLKLLGSATQDSGCCWTIDVFAQSYGPLKVTSVVAWIKTPGVTVASAASCSGTPAPTYTVGDTLVTWPIPGGIGGHSGPSGICVQLCVDSITTAPIEVLIMGFGPSPALYFVQPDLVTLANEPSCAPNCCEPDCNGNGIPDAQDLANGTSFDSDGNGILDECDLPPCSQVVESVTLRSGQVFAAPGPGFVPGLPGQFAVFVGFATRGAPDECFSGYLDDGSGLPFAAALAGPPPRIVSPISSWRPSLACDPDARWINSDYSVPPYGGPPLPYAPRSVLYAIPFAISTAAPTRARISLCWAVDDFLGDQFTGASGDPGTVGAYIMSGAGTLTPLPFSGGNYFTESGPLTFDLPANALTPGGNTLFLYQRDLACMVSGIIYSATIEVCDDSCSGNDDDDCLPGSVIESELCGTSVNDDCAPPSFPELISCGDRACGTFWRDATDRDVDLYEFCLASRTLVTISVYADVPVDVTVTDGACPATMVQTLGTGDCPSVATACLDAGCYRVAVAPSTTGPLVACGSAASKYILDMSCADCADCVPPPQGMIGWWSLDDPAGSATAIDPCGHPGSVMPGADPGVPGEVDGAFSFDGNGFVSVPASADFEFLCQGFAADAWVHPMTLPPAGTLLEDFGGLGGWSFGFSAASPGALELTLDTGSGFPCVTTSLPGTVASNVWTHVGFSVSPPVGGLRTVTFLINGAIAAVIPNVPCECLIGSSGVRIGSGLRGGFVGFLDEVELFDRELPTSAFQAIFNAGPAGKCKHHCHATWEAEFCANTSVTTATVVVCNDSAVPAQYYLSFLPYPPVPGTLCDGPLLTTFNVVGANPVSVAPGTCVNVSVNLSRPAGLVPTQHSCYDVRVTNVVTGAVAACGASAIRTSKWCWDPTPCCPTLAPNVAASIDWTVTNTGDPDGNMNYTFTVMGHDMQPDTEVVSLNGLPPGEPVVGTAILPAGESGVIAVEVTFLKHVPLEFFDLLVSGDENDDGDPSEVIASLALSSLPPPTAPPCAADLDGDGMVSASDLALVLGAWGGSGAADLDGNGIVDAADLAMVLGSWGACPQ